MLALIRYYQKTLYSIAKSNFNEKLWTPITNEFYKILQINYWPSINKINSQFVSSNKRFPWGLFFENPFKMQNKRSGYE